MCVLRELFNALRFWVEGLDVLALQLFDHAEQVAGMPFKDRQERRVARWPIRTNKDCMFVDSL